MARGKLKILRLSVVYILSRSHVRSNQEGIIWYSNPTNGKKRIKYNEIN